MFRRTSRYLALTATAALIAVCLFAGQQQPQKEVPASMPLRSIGAVFPRLSDSGEQIAFSYQGAIWRTPRSGGTMTRLTSDEFFDIEPAWSPDGTQIAYLKSRDFGSAGVLKIIRATDGAPVTLPRSFSARDKLYFDRDGKRLLGNFFDVNQVPSLAWLDLSTGELSKPVYSVQLRQKFALSNDRQWIVAVSSLDRPPDEQAGNNGPECDLWKVPAAGGEAVKITRFPARVYDLCWSADDQSLLLVTDLGGVHNDIWQLSLANPETGAKKLTFGQGDEDAPSVSADGRWLLTTDNSPGATGLVLRDANNGRSAWLEFSNFDYRQPTGRLDLKLIDRDTGLPLTGRCTIRHADGKHHAPPESLYRHSGEFHVYLEGQAEWTLPAGQYQIKVTHGPEYETARITCDVAEGRTTVQKVEMKRWTDQRSLGWYSGETHIHANYGYGHWYNTPRTMLSQCAGEDLVVCNFMVANSDGNGVYDREFFRGKLDPLSTPQTAMYWNEEFRSTIWGHMTVLNLKQVVEPVFTGFARTTNPNDYPTNADIGLATRDQDGLVNYTHPVISTKDPYLGAYSAKALPLDVALGTIHSMDVMGAVYEANLLVWYRLLNCGFRIPAAAGTDCFLNRIPSRPPGGDRAYVKIDGEFSYQRWIDGLKAGRSFVTNGPMVDLTVDGRLPGEVLPLASPAQGDPGAKVNVVARVRYEQPLNRVELVQNGQVIATQDVKEAGREVVFERSVPVATSGWLAVRASGPPHPDRPRGESVVHTGPVYVEVAGKPLDCRADADYFLAWIDRLWESIRQRNRIPPRHQPHVEAQIANARAVYQKLAERGK